MKKKIFLLASLAFAVCLIAWGYFKKDPIPLSDRKCAFCNPDILSKQAFYEDDLVLALYTHKPMMPAHCLIIPKRHVQNFAFLTDDESLAITQTIKKIDLATKKVFETESYLLLQKNGLEVGQTVPHVHFHYIGRKEGDRSTFRFLRKMLIAPICKPISQKKMDTITAKLKDAMEANN